MTEIVLNEKAFVEKVLDDMTLGDKPGVTISRVARYYAGLGYSGKEIVRLLEDFIIKCDPTANLFKWQSFIETQAKRAFKYTLIDIDGVSVTRNEMEKIKMLDGKILQKLMFTLLCLAKYGNAVNPKNNNWVNKEDKIIFSLANIAITTKRQSLAINNLWRHGYVGYSHAVDNINLNVKIVDSLGERVVEISDFRNLGNQYLRLLGEPYIECQNCGLVVRQTHGKQKVCKECAKDIDRRNSIERYRDSMATHRQQF